MHKYVGVAKGGELDGEHIASNVRNVEGLATDEVGHMVGYYVYDYVLTGVEGDLPVGFWDYSGMRYPSGQGEAE